MSPQEVDSLINQVCCSTDSILILQDKDKSLVVLNEMSALSEIE
jgi:hypothetical protein